VLQRRLGTADAGDAGALVAEQELGVGPALVLLADEVLRRHLDVLEPDFVDLVLAVVHDDRAHGDARRLHVDEQEGDALLLAAFADLVRTRQKIQSAYWPSVFQVFWPLTM
jgi:hypothetical protein